MDTIIAILSHQYSFIVYGFLIVWSIWLKVSKVMPEWYSKVFWYILVPLSTLVCVRAVYLSWWA